MCMCIKVSGLVCGATLSLSNPDSSATAFCNCPIEPCLGNFNLYYTTEWQKELNRLQFLTWWMVIWYNQFMASTQNGHIAVLRMDGLACKTQG